MIKEVKKTKETIVKYKFCDVCGTEIHIGLSCSSAKCYYCDKDICGKCIGNEEETGGDFRHVVCKNCWNIGNEYRPTIERLHKEIETLYEEWRTKCKETIR